MNCTKISLLLPTRGRPALAARFFRSVVERTRQLNAVEIVLYVDEDDTDSHTLNDENISITKIIGSRVSMGAYNTACLRRSSGDIVILVNDDMIIRTDGWDEQIRTLHAEIEDGIYLAYGNDLYKGKSLCAFPIISRRTCEILGDPFPSEYKGAFIDYHLLDIFKRLQKAGYDRIRYLENVVFEHMHFRSGKGKFDATYAGRHRFADDGVFLRLRDARSRAATKLLNAVEGNTRCFPSPSAAVSTGRQSDPTYAVLLDQELPWRWALRLYFWFLARLLMRRFLSVMRHAK